ncbi:hypothetical protein [Streptosporangium sp. NPDC002524]|uniref:hypothetical protein n=1 Tax=Streptosporangium sp. NPDC002524 TaxID=3154537 RepID=UPI00332B6F74
MGNESGWRAAFSALLIAGLLAGDTAGRALRDAGPADVRRIGELTSRWHLRYAAEPAAAGATHRVVPLAGNQAWLFVTAEGRPGTSLLHWNTSGWNPAGSLPGQLKKAGYIDVSASPSGDAVLVINHVPGEQGGSAEHLWQFSGGRWTRHRPRHLDWTGDFAVVGRNDVWLTQGGGPEGPPADMVHWDGTALRRKTPPEATDLVAVAAARPDDVWVVDDRGWPRTLHWNGERWRVTPLPCTPAIARRDCHGRPFLGRLSGLAAGLGNDAWAVGPGWADGARPVVLHWNGAAWNQVRLDVGHHTGLAAVRTDSVGGVWIAANPANGTPYVLNLRNGEWARSALPPRSGPPARIVDIAPAPGTTHLWVHAQHGDGPGKTSLVYELQ